MKTLQEIRDEASAKYRDEDFKNNPNGYTVAPYVNEETTATAFDAGFDSATKHLSGEIERLKGAIEALCRTVEKDYPFIRDIQNEALEPRERE